VQGQQTSKTPVGRQLPVLARRVTPCVSGRYFWSTMWWVGCWVDFSLRVVDVAVRGRVHIQVGRGQVARLSDLQLASVACAFSDHSLSCNYHTADT